MVNNSSHINKVFIFLLVFVSSNVAFSQLKGKVNKLIGTWEYREGSGIESWEKVNENELRGHGIRLNKVGDSVKVEDLAIQLVNKNLVYTIITGSGDSLNNSQERQFIGNKRKLYFSSLKGSEPRAIRYKFGPFNKNKLKIFIYYNEDERPQKLLLNRNR